MPDEPNFLADLFLSLCPPDPDRPFLTDPVLQRRAQYDRRKQREHAHRLVPTPPDPLLRRSLIRLLRRARLTDVQRVVLEWRMEGVTLASIAERMEVSTQAAGRIWKRVRVRLRQADREDPYRGLASVYRDEVRRGAGTSPAR